MGGFSGDTSTGSGSGGGGPAGKKTSGTYGTTRDAKKTSRRNKFSSAVKKVAKFVATGGITGALLRGITSSSKKNKKSKSGDVYDYNEAKEKIDYKPNSFSGGGRDDNPQGIEFAKASTTSATILGPGEIQKEAANNVKGPTTTEMTAGQISLANKRKGRRSTNITAKKTLAKNYTLSKKSLLG